METIFSARHHGHNPESEFSRGRLVAAYERPERADRVLQAVQDARLGAITEPDEFPLSHALRVHAGHYVDFLQRAYADWRETGRLSEAWPVAWPIRGFRSDRIPSSIDGRLSYYSFDGMTPIMEKTWDAVKSGSDIALTGAARIASGSARTAFSLCRPPGHHAASDYYGGYCFLNNAAIAAQYFRDKSAARVAILDIDYHHGNGTQEIFYQRSDVLFASIHANPSTDYPYFLGYADESGAAAGEGFNLNLPLPQGTGWKDWSAAFDVAAKKIASYAPDALVISLGVDTFKGDPLSAFRLESEDYLRVGERIARLGKPTLFVMEGGYALAEIGTNVVNVLKGYEGR